MLNILKAGFFNTVQDFGRAHYKHFGVSLTGALDKPAMTIANQLVGNLNSAAVIEVSLGPLEMAFNDHRKVALTGADFNATLDNRPVYPGWMFHVKPSQKLRLTHAKLGARAYIAIEGGIQVKAIMQSMATDLNSGIGGHHGRSLQQGDSLSLGQQHQAEPLNKPPVAVILPKIDKRIRIIAGPNFTNLTAQSQQALIEQTWQVTPSSNRMGLRLEGQALQFKESLEMYSHGVIPGTIQLPPSGLPIVLLADAQTTGGYPRVAQVIQADIHKLAQLRAGDKFTLQLINIDKANKANAKLKAYLNQIETGLAPKTRQIK